MFACRVSLNYVMAGPTRTPMRLMSLFVCFRLSGRPGGNPTGWAGRPAFAVPFGIPSLQRHSPSRCSCHRCHWHHQLRRAPCCNQVNRVWRCKMGCGVCGGASAREHNTRTKWPSLHVPLHCSVPHDRFNLSALEATCSDSKHYGYRVHPCTCTA